MSYGTNIKFGIAMQTSGGTPVPAANVGSFYQIPLLSEDFGLEKATIESANLNGSFVRGSIFDGINKVAGTIQMEALPKQLGVLMTACLGDPVRTTSGAAVKNWLFNPRTVDFDSYYCNRPVTVFKQFADASTGDLFYDVQFSDLEFDITAGQLLKVSATAVGGKRVTNGTSMNLGAVFDPTDYNDQWMWAVASVSYGGAAQPNFTDVKIKISANIDPLYGLNQSFDPIKYTRKDFLDVNVTGTFYMSDRAMLNSFVASTTQRLTVSLVNSATAVASGYFMSLLLDVPQVKITEFKPGASGPGEVVVRFSGMGVIDPTSNYAFQATLVNSFPNTVY